MFNFICGLLSLLIFCFSPVFSLAEDKYELFFNSSLHQTTDGMKFWYSKKNGGIENIAKVPYDNLLCKKCHAASCDTCHKQEIFDSFEDSIKHAKKQETCLKCHGREAKIINIDKKNNNLDVHFKSGMECMDCHTSKEIHGNGVKYKSMKEPGFFDVSCINCHNDIEETRSHTIHNGKLDCKACHNRHVVSCTNCHMDTLINNEQKKSIPVSGWLFLMNYDGKITSANTQTYVIDKNKTFIMFAPQHSHSIMSEGRKCENCHANNILYNASKSNKIQLTWINDNKTENIKGIIPVSENIKYDFVYQEYRDGEWFLIKNPEKPKIHYAGFGIPLSEYQLEKMKVPQFSNKN